MPDGRISIIDEKPFFSLSFQIRVHPIHHFRRRCSFRAGSHANRIEQTTHFPLVGGLFEPIFEWMVAAQVITKQWCSHPPILHLRTIATDFRIFMTPYDTLLHSPSGQLIHSSDKLAMRFKTTVWRVHNLLIPIRHPNFATSIPYNIQYLQQSYNLAICIPLSGKTMQSIDHL